MRFTNAAQRANRRTRLRRGGLVGREYPARGGTEPMQTWSGELDVSSGGQRDIYRRERY